MLAPDPGLLALALNAVGWFALGDVDDSTNEAVGVADTTGPTCSVVGAERPIEPASSVVVSWIW